MLSDIIAQTITSKSDMQIVAELGAKIDAFDAFLRHRRIDVVVFCAGDDDFGDPDITRLLQAHPRRGFLAIDPAADSGTLHHLRPVHDNIGWLARPTLAEAIRAGAALRRP